MDTYIKILPSNGLVRNCGFDVSGAITPADLPFANTLGYILLKVGSFTPKLYQGTGEEPGYIGIEFPGYSLEMQIVGCLPGETSFPFTNKTPELYDELVDAMTPNPGNGGIITLKTRVFVAEAPGGGAGEEAPAGGDFEKVAEA